MLLPSIRVSENIDFFSLPPNLSVADTELMGPCVLPVTGTRFTSHFKLQVAVTQTSWVTGGEKQAPMGHS